MNVEYVLLWHYDSYKLKYTCIQELPLACLSWLVLFLWNRLLVCCYINFSPPALHTRTLPSWVQLLFHWHRNWKRVHWRKYNTLGGIQFLAAVIYCMGIYIHCILVRMLQAYKLRNLILTLAVIIVCFSHQYSRIGRRLYEFPWLCITRGLSYNVHTPFLKSAGFMQLALWVITTVMERFVYWVLLVYTILQLSEVRNVFG